MEKNMRCKWLFLFLLSAFSLMLHAEGLPRNIQTGQKTVLTLTGKNTSIVIPSDAGKTLRFAARELQEFLSQILKSKIPLINAPGPPDISTRRLTPDHHFTAFGVCQELIGDEALASYQPSRSSSFSNSDAPPGNSYRPDRPQRHRDRDGA